MALSGDFPKPLLLSPSERKTWHQDYIELLIERDLKGIAEIHKVGAMRQLVSILAAWSGKFMDLSKVTSHLSMYL